MTAASDTIGYRIEDEPQPGSLTHLAVNPVWPLLAIMFGGVWLSWPWFALNAFAMGSPTRRRELALAVFGVAGSAVLALTLFQLADRGLVEGVGIKYALLVVTVWKLAVSYWLYVLQSRSFGLYEYYGGQVRNGAIFVMAAFFFRPRIVEQMNVLMFVIFG